MSTSDGPAFVVIGAGITGLTAAHELRRVAPGARVTLIEASDRLGGKLRTDRLDGAAVEAGADSFLAREPWAKDLCIDLGLGDDLVAPATFGALLWIGDSLHALPAGSVYGMPPSPGWGFRCGALSTFGAMRAAAEMVLPDRLPDRDVSVGDFVEARYGSEVLERLVDPLLAGTRSGDPHEMSLAAALPQVDRLARAHGSIMRALRADKRENDGQGPPPFLSLRGGLGRLVDTLRASLGDAQILQSTRAVSIRANDRYEIEMEDGATLEADGVIVTVPAFEAAGIIDRLSPRAAEIVAGIDYASVAVVTLVYSHVANTLPPKTSGLLVPSAQKRALSAATWYSIKWSDAQPDGGGVIVRCFAGRARRDPASDLDDDSLVERLVADMDDALGLGNDVRESRVVRWANGMPQYAVGHLSRIDEAEAVLDRDAPGVVLAGAGYRGSGISDCIAGAHRAVERLRKIEASVG